MNTDNQTTTGIINGQGEDEKFRLINVVEELTQMLSDRLWSDDQIKDRFVLASLADGTRAAAKALREELLT